MMFGVRLLSLAAALTLAAHASAAEPIKAAVFDFELVDTSLEGSVVGKNEAETARLVMLGERLRRKLGESGRYEVVDIAPLGERARAQNLQSCNGCDAKMAGELGAALAVTGTVQKVSNLILNVNLYFRDTASGKIVQAASADIRSNTDESWQRGLDWLLKNRIFAQAPAQ